MQEILRIALLGGGKMALEHAAAIRQCREARLVAVADPHVSASELVIRFGQDVAAYANPVDLLAAVRPDVVHIVTPPATHSTLARLCLEANANVYVEKPFALTTDEAESVLRLANIKGLRVCAAHQVLFQEAGRSYRRHMPVIGEIVHVESFFSFRPVRRNTGGGGPYTSVQQLIDIMPHPVYLLLDALPAGDCARAEITALDTSIDGEIRAVIRCGKTLACLVISLQARPIESWLRVMGTNGLIETDFVFGNVVRHLGPGASAPAVILKPFSRAWQIGWGSLRALIKLSFRRYKSYPGLAELLDLFYASIRNRREPPVTAKSITDTVRICEAISERLEAEEILVDERAVMDIRDKESQLPPLNSFGTILLTGGTGLLGRPTAQTLRAAGWRVRIPIRRNLRHRHRLPGVEYELADLSEQLPDSLLSDVETVVHLAAETSGTKVDHERNTIDATRNLLEAMQRMGIRRLVNISSVAVLKPSRFGRPLTEDSPVDNDNLDRGPYVWGKSEAERMANRTAQTGNLEVRTIRLGPLVDYDAFVAPGRLGREVARLFVAAGRPTSPISVCSIQTARLAILRCVASFSSFPPIVNLLDAPPPNRGQLIERLLQTRSELVVLWLPFWILRALSALAKLGAAPFRNRVSVIDLYAAFKSEQYESHTACSVIAASKES